MTTETKSNTSWGVGFIGLLTVLLLALKLTLYPDLSLIWVFSPIWISAAAVFVIIVLVIIAAAGIASKK